MNISLEDYSILKQVKKGVPYILLNHAQENPQFVNEAKSIIKSKPTIDYLCNTVIEKVRGQSMKNAVEELYDTEGILLYRGLTLIYKSKKTNNGTCQINFIVMKVVEFKASIKVEVKNKSVMATSTTQEPIEEQHNICVTDLIAFLLFKKHVGIVETNKNPQLNSTRTSNNNRTGFDYPINIINQLFYTSIKRHIPFPVKGHFRYYKKSGKTIEVKSFKKNGYQRKAKKISLAA
jgi:hypothetical protein